MSRARDGLDAEDAPLFPAHGELTAEQFGRIAAFVGHAVGIRMPISKREMVQARLGRRLRELGFGEFEEYLAYAFESPSGPAERMRLIDAVTTNKTDFFREADHFAFITETVVPVLREEDPCLGTERAFVAWSAGCATGEEAYSIAITLAEYGLQNGPLRYEVYGTDICADALLHASKGVYEERDVLGMPMQLRHRHLLRSRDRSSSDVRIAPGVRKAVRFARMNLLCDSPPFDSGADVVFCRNVLIYFDRRTQARVLSRIVSALRPGGYLFVGHSEMLHGFGLPLAQCAPTVHRRVR